jgi:hypothetical protein
MLTFFNSLGIKGEYLILVIAVHGVAQVHRAEGAASAIGQYSISSFLYRHRVVIGPSGNRTPITFRVLLLIIFYTASEYSQTN